MSEFLERKAPHYQPPKLPRQALLHGHCHHKSLFKMDAEENILRKMGVEFQAPETGCCGMAGAFGFETDHYDISMKCAGRVLLPEVRKTPGDALIITDGFSCHEQIAQATGRRPLHLAEVMQMAIRGHDPAQDRAKTQESSWPKVALVAGAVAAGYLVGKVLTWRR
jgi:Fe-S oxidoreductase